MFVPYTLIQRSRKVFLKKNRKDLSKLFFPCFRSCEIKGEGIRVAIFSTIRKRLEEFFFERDRFLPGFLASWMKRISSFEFDLDWTEKSAHFLSGKMNIVFQMGVWLEVGMLNRQLNFKKIKDTLFYPRKKWSIKFLEILSASFQESNLWNSKRARIQLKSISSRLNTRHITKSLTSCFQGWSTVCVLYVQFRRNISLANRRRKKTEIELSPRRASASACRRFERYYILTLHASNVLSSVHATRIGRSSESYKVLESFSLTFKLRWCSMYST